MLPKFIIGGVEHSGTTLLSDIFRQVEGIDSGFEVGVLLCNTPREFRSFKPFINQMPEGWGLNEEDLDYICDTEDFEEFYGRLYERSNKIKKPCEIFDKTPRYAWGLEKCLQKFHGKYIFMYKDPRALVFSNWKRYGKNFTLEEFLRNFLDEFKKYWEEIYYNYKKYKNYKNILTVSLEDITLNTKNTLSKVFDFVGIPFKIDYLLLKNLRYPHTRADHISVKVTFEYKLFFSKEQIKEIERELNFLEEWFYE